jgi:hypothetical protein
MKNGVVGFTLLLGFILILLYLNPIQLWLQSNANLSPANAVLGAVFLLAMAISTIVVIEEHTLEA